MLPTCCRPDADLMLTCYSPATREPKKQKKEGKYVKHHMGHCGTLGDKRGHCGTIFAFFHFWPYIVLRKRSVNLEDDNGQKNKIY